MSQNNRMSVYYDEQCAFCRYCVQWLLKQAKFIEIDFYLFPQLQDKLGKEKYHQWFNDEKELVVIYDNAIFKHNKALLMCLYALIDYREWSYRLSSPALLPRVKNVYNFISASRYKLSILLRLSDDKKVSNVLDCYTSDQKCDIQ